MNNEVIFSHRPRTGISVGASSDGSRLTVALSLVNDGTSRNGIVWADRIDSFSRSVARSIIEGRIADVRGGSSSDFVVTFETDMTARAFMAEFRRRFKPCVNETDATFVDTVDFGEGLNIQHRMTADNMVNTTMAIANEVVAGVTSVS